MTDVEQRIQCRWCHAQSPGSARTCDRCGAPLDVRDSVSDSGWRQAPRLRDLTQFHWAASSCQLDAGVVPVAEMTLDEADSVFFEHHTMLWKDETVPMSVMNTPGGAKRILSGMPFVLSVARGPGRVAFSRDAAGELVVIPIEAPAEVDVREHALVLATGTLTYSFEKLPGLRAMFAASTGMYLDRYVAQGAPGLLVLHGYGNVFQRALGEGETILVEPGGFLYKDSSVAIEVVSINLKGNVGRPPPRRRRHPAAAPSPAPEQAAPQGRFGRGLKGLMGAKSMLSVGALASAAGNLRSGGGIAGVAAGLAGGGGATMMRLQGPGRVGCPVDVQGRTRPNEGAKRTVTDLPLLRARTPAPIAGRPPRGRRPAARTAVRRSTSSCARRRRDGPSFPPSPTWPASSSASRPARSRAAWCRWRR